MRKDLIQICAVSSIAAILSLAGVRASESDSGMHMYRSEEHYENTIDWVHDEVPGEEVIYNHLDEEDELDFSDEERSGKKHLGASKRLGVDRLCTSTNTVDNTCHIKDKPLRFTGNFYYETELSLVFTGVTLRCITIQYNPCAIEFKLKGGNSTHLTMSHDSSFQGKQVIIDAPDSKVSFLTGSSLYASGQSYSTNGTTSDGDGASYIGSGGSCGHEDQKSAKRYGEFDMMPTFTDLLTYDSQLGSMGQSDDVETAGGGRVVLIADSVELG